MRDWEKILRMARNGAWVVLLAVLTVEAILLPKMTGAASVKTAASVGKALDPLVQKMDGTLTNVQATTANLAATTEATKKLVEMVSKDYYDPSNPEAGLFWDVYAMLESSTAASRTTEETLEDVRAALLGGRDTRGVQHSGVFPAITGLVGDLRTTVQDADRDLNRLTNSTDEALKPLAGTMQNIESLSADLERELKEGGNLDKTFVELAKAVKDFDALLADPDIKKTLANIERTSGSIAESAKSVDIALRPWRQKANQLKMILGKIAGMLKVVWSF